MTNRSIDPRRQSQRATAEFIGTALLLAAVVGSGIMGERLSGGNVAIALLANSIATGAGLVALILTFGPISGAHFNPAVTLSDAFQGGTPWREVPSFILAQVAGAFVGVAVANLMFEEPVFFSSRHVRQGGAQLLSEFVATFGLLMVIWGCARSRNGVVPFAVGAYITAAYWFTSSTSFANPAVTLARSATDTFAGIRMEDVPGFVVVQFGGAASAILLFRWLKPSIPKTSPELLVPHLEPTLKGPMTRKNKTYKILFLCTGNSARSIFGEYLIKRIGGDRFESYSAGTEPTGRVNPFALQVLHDLYHIEASAARSKSCDEYQDVDFDFVVTVCDNARESCPVWPGQPIIAHWGVPDPALVVGSDEQVFRGFKQAALQLQRRIELFCSLPIEKLDRLKLEKLIRDIGKTSE